MLKKLLAVFALIIIPTISLATYEPDSRVWTWYQSTPYIGYFISKEPVTLISETKDTLVLSARVQLVNGHVNPNQIKYVTSVVIGTYNKKTGKRTHQELDIKEFYENGKTFTNLPSSSAKIDVPNNLEYSIYWTKLQMILDTYNNQKKK
ncbi:hypothetical protein [Veillonella criceti]|uniref:Uncharacterized protein n=1 Tax=Veillonella criceti TaxID=103891 RepID=A0A380NKN5_9FIRM|nr:hypothetical protein [Veillonella criceti]SUP43390.1 Uncharacterised protein [Veillonella criceti]